jgi:nigerose phosphorylase
MSVRELFEWAVRESATRDGGTCVASDDEILANGNRLLIGNGYLGYRGTVEEADASYLVACNLNGVYDKRGELWREPVNAPNGLSIRLSAGEGAAKGAALSIKDSRLASHAQELDFRYGIHSRVSAWRVGDTTVTVRAERFASLVDVHLLCLKYTLNADEDIRLELRQGIDCAIWDINGPHLERFAYGHARDELSVGCRTQELGIPLASVSVCSRDFEDAEESFAEAQGIYRIVSLEAKKGREYTLCVFSSVYTGLDGRNEGGHGAVSSTGASTAASILAQASASAHRAAAIGYAAALEEHKEKWDALWDRSDVEIEGDDYARRALRYSLYHLQIIAPRHAGNLSIPARGLSGQTYKGAVFWDTEMFIAPFFLYTDPEVAKGFIRYRIATLDGARRKAAEYGYRGAFYAWESQETGDDACSHFNVVDVFTGRPMRTYFRDKQIHISADVVYAIRSYIDITGDSSILEEGALEVVLECARFFLSYAYYSPERQRYEILDVTGPDEYHERVNNDAFTNRMVKLCLDTAQEYIARLALSAPGQLDRVMEKIGFNRDMDLLAKMSAALYVPAPGEGSVIEQFDGYHKLEDCSLDDLRSRLLDPKEYWGGANGVASSTSIIKQADVVLMLNLFGGDYAPAAKKANLDFYEPRTEHGSSLSRCMYSLLACETGDSEWAYPFFLKAAEIDITGEGKHYAGLIYIGGTHPAASGGAWMAAIQGFCGLSIEGGSLRVRPRLPAAWTKVSFSATLRGVDYLVEVRKDGYTIARK